MISLTTPESGSSAMWPFPKRRCTQALRHVDELATGKLVPIQHDHGLDRNHPTKQKLHERRLSQ